MSNIGKLIYDSTTGKLIRSDTEGNLLYMAGDVYVSTTGDDANDGLTPETAKATIQSAVHIVPEGGIVLVLEGVYESHYIEAGYNKDYGPPVTFTPINAARNFTIMGEGRSLVTWKNGFAEVLPKEPDNASENWSITVTNMTIEGLFDCFNPFYDLQTSQWTFRFKSCSFKNNRTEATCGLLLRQRDAATGGVPLNYILAETEDCEFIDYLVPLIERDEAPSWPDFIATCIMSLFQVGVLEDWGIPGHPVWVNVVHYKAGQVRYKNLTFTNCAEPKFAANMIEITL